MKVFTTQEAVQPYKSAKTPPTSLIRDDNGRNIQSFPCRAVYCSADVSPNIFFADGTTISSFAFKADTIYEFALTHVSNSTSLKFLY
tara:strand:- start:195 stop:455 length:261 start_codon:yes stop_codon:yes gene_type:complete